MDYPSSRPGMNPEENKATFFGKLFPVPEKILFWLLLALLVKACLFYFKVDELKHIANPHFQASIAREAGDTFTYLQPIENLISTGHYEDDFRMPGYGWIYFLLRLFLSIPTALNTLVILQLLLSSISVYYLALIARIIFKENIYFYCTFLLYLISTFVTLYDPILLTESFATASFIFSIYFLLKPFKAHSDFILSGTFLTWCIFLKPVFAPLLLLFAVYIIYDNKAEKVKFQGSNLKPMLLFLLPFILADGSWTARNYSKHKGFYPLTTSLYFKSTQESYLGSLIEFVQAYGGSIVWWEPGAAITYFKPLPGSIHKQTKVQPPETIYTSAFNADSLTLVKTRIATIDAQETDSNTRATLTLQVKEQLQRYSQSIKKEKAFLYYFSSRLKICKTFFLHSGTYNLFYKPSSELSTFHYLLKVMYSLLYLVVAFLGLLGLFLLFLNFKTAKDYFFFALTGLYAGLSIPILLKFDEYRYFVTAYPLFLIAGIFASLSIFGFLKNKIVTHA